MGGSVTAGTDEGTTVKGNGGYGDYPSTGDLEIWSEEHPAPDGLDPGHTGHRPPSRQKRCEGGSSLGALHYVAQCELHLPREAELLRLNQLEAAYDQQKTLERGGYPAMDNFHSPVPPPLPRRHVR